METEIIKTDNPDIVIERTTIDKEINLWEMNNQIANFENEIDWLDQSISQLELSKQWLPDFIIAIVDEKINKLLSDKATAQYQIELLNTNLSRINA